MKENLDWLKRFNPKKTCSKETTEKAGATKGKRKANGHD